MVIAILLLSPSALAHPLGNESINHISILWILPDRVEFDLFLDFAEGPSRGFPQEIDVNRDRAETPEENQAWLLKNAAEYAPFLKITVNGKPVPIVPVEEAVNPVTGKKMPGIPGLIKIPGVAGMPTYKTLIRYVGRYPDPLGPGPHALEYHDATFGQYSGLKRIILEEVPIVEVLPPHPDFLDPEGAAFLYDQYDPANLPDERKATITFRIPGAVARPADAADQNATDQSAAGFSPRGPDTSENAAAPDGPAPVPSAGADVTASDAATADASRWGAILDPRNDPAKAAGSSRQATRIVALLQGKWGPMVFLTVTALSFIWGAGHALMPGHAKTVVAAYLISRSGTYWHAVALAIIVTITHTALVVIVGLVIWAYQATHPTMTANLQLWLGMIAGLLVAGMGLTLVWRALTGRLAHHHHDHDHHHGHGHHHHHHDPEHDTRSWFRKLLTHSHPRLPLLEEEKGRGSEREMHAHGHCHHDPGHGHSHEHDHAHVHAHSHGHDHVHTHAHDHNHAHAHSHEHDHPRGHHHHHHPHDHAHDHGHAIASTLKPHASSPQPRASGPQPLSFRLILLLGITGGIVPCPTATIILLLGIGANVVAGALYAVGIFSLGLALTLMLIGFLALSSRRIAARILSDAHHEGELSTRGQRLLLQVVPALSGALVIALGLAITANYIYYLRHGQALIGWLG